MPPSTAPSPAVRFGCKRINMRGTCSGLGQQPCCTKLLLSLSGCADWQYVARTDGEPLTNVLMRVPQHIQAGEAA